MPTVRLLLYDHRSTLRRRRLLPQPGGLEGSLARRELMDAHDLSASQDKEPRFADAGVGKVASSLPCRQGFEGSVAAEELGQHHGVVMLAVASAVQDRHRSLAGAATQLVELLPLRL